MERVCKILKSASWPVLIGLVLFAWLHIALITRTFWFDADGDIRSTIAGYGDIPLHLTQISKFAYTNPFQLDEPIYYGERLSYPFVINLVSGLLLRMTNSWSFSVLFPPLIFTLISIWLLFAIYKKYLNKSWIAYTALVVFFLGTGFGAYPHISRAIQEHSSIGAFVETLTKENVVTVTVLDAHYPNQNIDFGAPLTF